MANLNDNVAPSWKPNTLHEDGSVYLYDKKLYLCTEKHTSGDDFDPSKFEKKYLVDLVIR